jgi:hypothetical protein
MIIRNVHTLDVAGSASRFSFRSVSANPSAPRSRSRHCTCASRVSRLVRVVSSRLTANIIIILACPSGTTSVCLVTVARTRRTPGFDGIHQCCVYLAGFRGQPIPPRSKSPIKARKGGRTRTECVFISLRVVQWCTSTVRISLRMDDGRIGR